MAFESGSRRQFQMRERLGKGGFGVVYRATMQSPGGLRSDVAVKLLHNPTEDSLRRLRKEAKLLAALSHPAILRVHDLVKLEGRVALVTEYVGGLDLTDAFQVDPTLSPRALIQVVGVVAEAIHAAWNAVPPGGTEPLRLVHRDIKPANVRIGAHGEVKLLDFGIAWAEESDQSVDGQTHGTSFLGSVPYMAPERFGRTMAAPQSDVYALGCTLYEGLAGKRMHHDVTLGEMARRSGVAATHDEHVRRCVDELRDIPEGVLELLRDCLHHDEADRPAPVDVYRRCEALVDDMKGQRLKAWCRALPEGNAIEGGPLSGQVLSEGTLAFERSLTDEVAFDQDYSGVPPTASFKAEDLTADETWGPQGGAILGSVVQADSLGDDRIQATGQTTPEVKRRSPMLLWGGVVAVVAVLGIGGAFFALGNVQAVSVSAETTAEGLDGLVIDDGAATAAEPPVGKPAAGPADPPEDPVEPTTDAGTPEPEPTPASATPAPARPTPRPRVAKPAPAPAEPEPEPAAAQPEPAAAPKPPGRFAVIGEVSDVQLVSGDGTRYGPGDVPPGTYSVHAAFTGGERTDTQTRLQVTSGGQLTVRCNPVQWTCDRVR